ncbi:MAG TPA: hypothetical protein VGK29_18070 [Paludibaculum sp.]
MKTLFKAETKPNAAKWFEDNQDHLLRLFGQALQEGTTRTGKTSVGISLAKKTESLRRPPYQK